MGRVLRAFIETLRLTFRWEHLDAASPQPRRTRNAGALRMLFAPEPLAFDPPTVKRPRRGIARMLFAPEQLPYDPPAPHQRRARWPRWLFAREPLDRS